ncbi:hypothetical protein PHLGIDRAFT_110275 [Phlebiopsis gigantea 11061_1 CR5-6]|uniref:AB hydrolase-1 domain-containing protein n=1 Tax=Phlebiopsis gigantea (strain 11061_1 CR5-6) TaxID=745531 RepID=A0A0C3RTE2_PHLG1|nr:hypothetical protein PHLGIDRAFT_110275 [Phlebiopsis gigantea 11061_1 CR5-6]
MSSREEKAELIAPVGHRPVRQQTGLFKQSVLLYAVIAAAGYASWVYVRQCGGVEKTAVEDVSFAKFDWAKVEPSKNISWTTCHTDQKCARLTLPLDYLSKDPNGPTTQIALRMIPAKDRQNYRGTILINPGGPGGSGTNLVERAGANISRIVGDSFDVLGFDPRGIGASTPRADCFGSDADRQIWSMQDDHRLLNLSDPGTITLSRARQQLAADRCEQAIGGPEGIGRFMSTASVARDMLEITTKLGQEKLQYWGFSYGSVLGQYFSAMYPDSVGRVVIDGVYDSHNYRDGLWNSNLADTDAVVGSFADYCHEAGPLRCPVYASSPAKIQTRFENALAQLDAAPLVLGSIDQGPGIVHKKDLASMMFGAAYKPITNFPDVARVIAAVESRNVSAFAELRAKIAPPYECNCSPDDFWTFGNEAFNAIACGDAEDVTYDPARYAHYLKDLAASSPFAAPIWGVHHLQCTEWHVRPTWRYAGALAANATAHPLLVVSPRYDPVCPLSDAQKVTARYGGARLLVQNSHGHCSLAAPSVCTAKHVRRYFEEGVLPDEGIVCEPDELPFVGVADGVGALAVEDRELLDAMRSLGEALPVQW